MNIIGVIPARLGSTRLKAKVLADIAGKPMIRHVWENARQSKLLDHLIIACDDKGIKEVAEGFGAEAVLTSKNHQSGSDRIAEAVKDLNVEIVVNIQGDEPLTHPSMIDAMAATMLEDKDCPMATVITPIKDETTLNNPNVVKAVIDLKGFALYFSRSVIPFNRAKGTLKEVQYFKHLGLYAYRKKFLMDFKNLPSSRLEKAEKLEQLRVLEAGYKIKTVTTEFDTIAVDTQSDLERVEKVLKTKAKRG